MGERVGSALHEQLLEQARASDARGMEFLARRVRGEAASVRCSAGTE